MEESTASNKEDKHVTGTGYFTCEHPLVLCAAHRMIVAYDELPLDCPYPLLIYFCQL